MNLALQNNVNNYAHYVSLKNKYKMNKYIVNESATKVNEVFGITEERFHVIDFKLKTLCHDLQAPTEDGGLKIEKRNYIVDFANIAETEAELALIMYVCGRYVAGFFRRDDY